MADVPNFKYDESDLDDATILDKRKTQLEGMRINTIELKNYITFNSNKIESIKFEEFYQEAIKDKVSEQDKKTEIDLIKTAIKEQIKKLKREEKTGNSVVSADTIQKKLEELIINTTIVKILTLLYAYLVFRQQFNGSGPNPVPPVPPVPGKIDLKTLLGVNFDITTIYNPYLLNNTTDNASRSIFSLGTSLTQEILTKIEKGEPETLDKWTHLSNNPENFKLLTALVARTIKITTSTADDKTYIDISNKDTDIITALEKGVNTNVNIIAPSDTLDKVWEYSKTIVTNAIRINQREEARALNVYYYALDTIPLYMNIGLTEAST